MWESHKEKQQCKKRNHASISLEHLVNIWYHNFLGTLVLALQCCCGDNYYE